MGHCHKCEIVLPDSELTVCYHYDEVTILGVLCDRCVQAWFAFESGWDEQ